MQGKKADALVAYLRDPTSCTYSPTNPLVSRGEIDFEFLFNNRQMHCELFDSAFVAMIRSIGITSRLITRFRSGEYNHIGRYYLVRQGHRHTLAIIYLAT